MKKMDRRDTDPCDARPGAALDALAGAVAAGQLITDSELQHALQIAGLQSASGGASANAEDSLPFRLEAKDSGYHEGMTPNETWDAGMLIAAGEPTPPDTGDPTNLPLYLAVAALALAALILIRRLRSKHPHNVG